MDMTQDECNILKVVSFLLVSFTIDGNVSVVLLFPVCCKMMVFSTLEVLEYVGSS